MASRLRALAAGALLAGAAACCPVPAALGPTPTAFAAVVVHDGDAGWIAEARDGTRFRVDGAAPAAVGARVYVQGAIGSDGRLVVDRVDVVAAR